MDFSRGGLRPFRKNRVAMLKEFVGSYYSDNGAPNEVVVNLLNLTADAYTVGLASNSPKVMVKTNFPELRSFAYGYQKTLNDFCKEIRFNEILQKIVLDAFFSYGISKVFMDEWKAIQLDDDIWADPGRPHIARISPDDFGCDMSVKDIRRCRFMWDEYRVPWQSVVDNGDYDKKIVKMLSPNSKWERGDAEEANQITTGAIVDDDELEPMIDLMDVWLPEIEKIGVFSRHVVAGPLKLVDPGPEGGPYDFLHFADVPDNVIPSSPAHNLMGLHLLYNGLVRKQARQAKRQKTNPTYSPSATEDAERMKRVNDGDWVKVSDPQGINVVSQGGVDQTNMAFSMSVMDLFNRQAGNLSAMAGLGPQAPTLGQEQMIYSAVSRKEAKMQQRVHEFTAKSIGKIGHLIWADAYFSRHSSVEARRGTRVYIDTSWTPEKREGDFWQYNFDIEQYSTNYEPPEAKAQKMERVISQLVTLAPLLQQMGGTIDVQELVRQYSEMLNIPELDQVVTFATPPQIQRPGPSGEGSGKPAETTRNYIRRNVPTGGTPESRSSILQQTLMGGGQVTPKQMASVLQ